MYICFNLYLGSNNPKYFKINLGIYQHKVTEKVYIILNNMFFEQK